MRFLGGAAVAFAIAVALPSRKPPTLPELKRKGVLRAIVAADEAPETFALGGAVRLASSGSCAPASCACTG